jgi:molybdopterin biosynthesis enzyme
MGREPAEPQPVRARLEKVHIARSARPTYHPARLEWTPAGPTVLPLPWHGSSDLQATVDANAMALAATGEGQYKPGDELLVFPWNE